MSAMFFETSDIVCPSWFIAVAHRLSRRKSDPSSPARFDNNRDGLLAGDLARVPCGVRMLQPGLRKYDTDSADNRMNQRSFRNTFAVAPAQTAMVPGTRLHLITEQMKACALCVPLGCLSHL